MYTVLPEDRSEAIGEELQRYSRTVTLVSYQSLIQVMPIREDVDQDKHLSVQVAFASLSKDEHFH